MKIELIKLKFNDRWSYKYKPFKFCCRGIENNESIVFADHDLVDSDTIQIYGTHPIPQICISETYFDDGYEFTRNHPILYCPYCGEKIEINVVNEIDVSERFGELVKERNTLSRICRKTDSKKEEEKLNKKITEISNQINKFYWLDEMNNSFLNEKKLED